jgi:hypothetical protein
VEQIDAWILELDEIELRVRRDFAPLAEAQLNRRPGEGRWSASECLDHLAVTTTLMLEQVRPVLAEARTAGTRGGEGPFRFGLIGGWFVKMMEKPGKRPLPAPKNFVPSSGLAKDAVLKKFDGAMGDLRKALESGRGLALDRVKARSSAEGGSWIRLNVAAWFASSLAHCRRHLGQAERAVESQRA